MTWPTLSDYQEAVQCPRACFSDGALQAGQPALNGLGLPQPITGGFASVYQLVHGKSRWAVRCFLHRIPDLQERYALISRALKSKPLRCAVGFDFLTEGIRVKGSWYPALKMEWVDGDTLSVGVKKLLSSPKALLKLADRWADLVESLERASIAHGDLQHGNVLIAHGEFRLIDYDGMFVPALKGRGCHEKGHPAFQHPKRSGRDFDADIDRFSALVIHLSLLALARETKLWSRFHDEDNLLFRSSDFASPDSSEVFKAVESVGDPLVSRLAEILRRACRGSLREVPRLAEALKSKVPEKARVPVMAAAGAAPAPVERPKPTVEKPKGGWQSDWVRPGLIQERHIYKDPVYGTREVPRRFLFIPLGLRRVKFVERYEDRVKERTSTVDGHRSTITSLAFSSDGVTLASGSSDRTVRVWNVGTGREVALLLEARSAVSSLALVPGRPALAAALEDGHLILWDFGLQRQVLHLEAPDRSKLDAVAVSSDGRWVAAGGRGRSVFVWQVDRGTPAGAFEGLGGRIGALAFTEDGAGVISATRNGRVERLDRGSAKPRWSVRTDAGAATSLVVPPRASTAVGGAESGLVIAWDLRDGRELWTADPGAGRVRSMALSPDAGHVVLGLDDRTARVTALSSRAEIARLEGHPRRVTAVALSPLRKAAATGGDDGSVRLWIAR